VAHVSVILAASLCWNDATTSGLWPKYKRIHTQNESAHWQQLSQHGADAESHAMPSVIRRTHRLDNRLIEVAKRARRLPPPNRLLEIHGLAGAIGEQLGLAWTAEQDVQRFVETRSSRTAEHQRLIQRALAELAGHFVLGASHSLANLSLRLLLLNQNAAAALSRAYRKANGFPPGSDDRFAWLTFSGPLVDNLIAAAEQSGNRFMVRGVAAIADLHASPAFTALDTRRGLDYHRRRPQSVPHVSPRRQVLEHLDGFSRLTMPAPDLEPDADPEAVHRAVVDGMEELRRAMRNLRVLLPKIIRAEGVTYIF
jgi:hypothetical protein